MRWVRQWNNCSPPFSTSSTVIRSGPEAELLFQFFMTCFVCFMLKISEELVWFSSRTESISSSVWFLKWNFLSFSDIFWSSKMLQARFSVVDGLNNVICFPAMNFLSYLCQNWVESLDSFKNLILPRKLYFCIFPWLLPFFVSLLEIVLIYIFLQNPSSLFWQL